MNNVLIALGIGAVAGFAFGWCAHRKYVATAISASRKIRRRALGGRRG